VSDVLLEVAKLRQHSPQLYTFLHHINMLGSKVSTRMTVIVLNDRSLFVHSPLSPKNLPMFDLTNLGVVKHIVAPNCYHHLFVKKFHEAYPSAMTYCAPGLVEKRKDMKWDAVLTDEAPEVWKDEIEQHVVQGLDKLGEVVFFHAKSRTLLLTDLAFNLKREHTSFPFSAYLSLFGGYKQCCVSWPFRFFINDKKALKNSLHRIMEWDFDRVLLTHGDTIETEGKEAFRNGTYSFFLRYL